MKIKQWIPLCLLLSAGCWTLAVETANPKPNVMVPADKAAAVLELAPAVQDQFVVAKTGSVNEVTVKNWRGTLESGFKNAFGSSGQSNRKLTVLAADLSFAPAAASMYGTAAVISMIRYKAQLLDGTGKEIAALAGTVQAREANVSPTKEGMTDNASKAVEALYEKLGSELMANH